LTPSPPGRAKSGHGEYCGGICQKYTIHKKLHESIYKYAVLCSNCNSYIPRKELTPSLNGAKTQCPCCKKTWIKGLYKLV